MSRSYLLPVLVVLLTTQTARSAPQAPSVAASSPPLPVSEWTLEGERKDFDWDLDVNGPDLRMDQRFEVRISATVKAGDLETTETGHELSLVTGITDREGLWLATSDAVRESLTPEVPEKARVELELFVSLKPGRYIFWIVLVDESTGQRNVEEKEIKVDDIGDDPLPMAYSDFPIVEFSEGEWIGGFRIRAFASDLNIPVTTRRALDLELVASISAPEQWLGAGPLARHSGNVLGAMTALSQLDLGNGSITITGMDLLRREIVLEHEGSDPVDPARLAELFDRVNRSAISVDALADRSNNPVFLREYVEGLMADRMIPDGTEQSGRPLRVLIFVGGVMRFEDHPDLSPVELDGPCDCRVYHIRLLQEPLDLFDQIDDLLDPFDPPTYDVLSPRDLRKAIAKIVEDLGRS